MPVIGGIEAAQAIRALDPELPILALTADTAAEDVERCRAAGMDGHLAKPVALPALRAELDRRITPVLDDALLDELAENLGGRALVDQMLAVYRGGLAARLDALRAAGDPEALRDAAHALRSPSAGFGIARLAGACAASRPPPAPAAWRAPAPAVAAGRHADRTLARPAQSGCRVETAEPASGRAASRGARAGGRVR